MAHVLQKLLNDTDGFVLIGDSSEDRFPGYSYNAYTKAGKRFYCLDLGGLDVSRGPTSGGKVYKTVAELWVKPRSAAGAVDVAHEAGCTRVWFSFLTGHPDAVARARELGMEVVEIGRCPVYYLDGAPAACAAHTLMVKVSGARRRPPQLDAKAKRREMI